MTELQTVVLALECIPSSCSVKMCLNSQAVLDTCVLESRLDGPNFHNFPSVVSESFLSCVFDIGLYALLYKDFVPAEWFKKAVQIFVDCKEATRVLVGFV
ncbi:hypothetical protein G9A89_001752 [Geosiphon pyriformis]|nr:hypothetical protein G9A89_001752 [Geosiphon pyriformis]